MRKKTKCGEAVGPGIHNGSPDSSYPNRRHTSSCYGDPIDAWLKGCRLWEPGAFKLAGRCELHVSCLLSADPASIPGLVPQQQQQSGGVLDNVPQSRVNPDLFPG